MSKTVRWCKYWCKDGDLLITAACCVFQGHTRLRHTRLIEGSVTQSESVARRRSISRVAPKLVKTPNSLKLRRVGWQASNCRKLLLLGRNALCWATWSCLPGGRWRRCAGGYSPSYYHLGWNLLVRRSCKVLVFTWFSGNCSCLCLGRRDFLDRGENILSPRDLTCHPHREKSFCRAIDRSKDRKSFFAGN